MIYIDVTSSIFKTMKCEEKEEEEITIVHR